jgi:hypothetical protein
MARSAVAKAYDVIARSAAQNHQTTLPGSGERPKVHDACVRTWAQMLHNALSGFYR